MKGTRQGVALVEVLIALTILGVAGAATAWELQQALFLSRRAGRVELELEAANRVLSATALLLRPELENRLGRRTAGEFLVSIERIDTALYRAAVTTAARPTRELLVTLLYRPRTTSGRP